MCCHGWHLGRRTLESLLASPSRTHTCSAQEAICCSATVLQLCSHSAYVAVALLSISHMCTPPFMLQVTFHHTTGNSTWKRVGNVESLMRRSGKLGCAFGGASLRAACRPRPFLETPPPARSLPVLSSPSLSPPALSPPALLQFATSSAIGECPDDPPPEARDSEWTYVMGGVRARAAADRSVASMPAERRFIWESWRLDKQHGGGYGICPHAGAIPGATRMCAPTLPPALALIPGVGLSVPSCTGQRWERTRLPNTGITRTLEALPVVAMLP